MPNIKWIGILNDDISRYQKGELDSNAKKMIMPSTMEEMMIKALPFVIVPFLIIVLSMFIKTFIAQQVVVNPIFVLIGFILSFLGLYLHELLHAVVYPSGVNVYIGIYPKAFAAVALASYPLTRIRFIIMSLIPLILGIVPIIIFCISPIDLRNWNGFWFGLSMMGLISPYPDCYNVSQVLKQTPRGSCIQVWGDDTFWIE